MSSNISIPKKCQQCGNMFVARTTVTKFCSHKCASKNYKKRAKEDKIQTSLTELASTEINTTTSSTNNVNAKDFLSIKDAALLVGASRWTIQRMIQAGQLKSAKFGNRTIIQRADINNLFK
jgi:excisionase family DNA binding protein